MIVQTFTMFLVLLAVDFEPSALRVRIETLEGTPREVRLTSIKDGRLFCASDDGTQPVAIEDLMRIRPLDRTEKPTEASPPGPHSLVVLDPGALRGRLLAAPPDRKDTLALDAGWPEPILVPFDALAAVRVQYSANSAAEREFQARLRDRPRDKDVLLIAKPPEVAVLHGALEGIDDRRVEFSIARRRQAPSLTSVYAVVLAKPPGPGATPPPVTVLLADEQQLAGRIDSADARMLRLEAGRLGFVEIPWSAIKGVELASPRVAWVSDLKPTKTRTRFLLDSPWPPRLNRAVGGGPLRLRGVDFDRGVGIHAYTALTYTLDGTWERFRATIGIDDGVGPHGSVQFRVIVDGKTAYESPLLRGGEPPVPVEVELAGAAEITLECDPGPDLDISDHADWAGAVLIRSRTNPVR